MFHDASWCFWHVVVFPVPKLLQEKTLSCIKYCCKKKESILHQALLQGLYPVLQRGERRECNQELLLLLLLTCPLEICGLEEEWRPGCLNKIRAIRLLHQKCSHLLRSSLLSTTISSAWNSSSSIAPYFQISSNLKRITSTSSKCLIHQASCKTPQYLQSKTCKNLIQSSSLHGPWTFFATRASTRCSISTSTCCFRLPSEFFGVFHSSLSLRTENDGIRRCGIQKNPQNTNVILPLKHLPFKVEHGVLRRRRRCHGFTSVAELVDDDVRRVIPESCSRWTRRTDEEDAEREWELPEK